MGDETHIYKFTCAELVERMKVRGVKGDIVSIKTTEDGIEVTTVISRE